MRLKVAAVSRWAGSWNLFPRDQSMLCETGVAISRHTTDKAAEAVAMGAQRRCPVNTGRCRYRYFRL